MKELVLKERQVYEYYDNIQEAIEKYPNLVRERDKTEKDMFLFEYRSNEETDIWIPFDEKYSGLLIYNSNKLKDLGNGVFIWCEQILKDRIGTVYKEL